MEGNGAANNPYKRRCIKSPWEPHEDKELIRLVGIHGVGNWNCIADCISKRKRTGQSCRLRWFNQLDPRLNKSPFTEEEQIKLLKYHQEYGNKWAAMTRFFPGRTDNQLKNQYHVLVGSRNNKASSTPSSSTVTTFAVGSQCSNNSGFAPHVAGGIDTPMFSDGPALVYDQPVTNCGDCMMPDENSAIISESWPAAEPIQGAYYGDYQFIDFLGVGNI